MTPFVMIQNNDDTEVAVAVTSWRWLEDKGMLLLYHNDKQIQVLEGEQAYTVYRKLYGNTIVPMVAEKTQEELCVL